MRNGASVSQLLQLSSGPWGLRITGALLVSVAVIALSTEGIPSAALAAPLVKPAGVRAIRRRIPPLTLVAFPPQPPLSDVG